MITEVFRAFKEANVKDETAMQAVEAINIAVTSNEKRFAGYDAKFEKISSDVSWIKWILVIMATAILGLYGFMFEIISRLPK
jgi:hypothetical protein